MLLPNENFAPVQLDEGASRIVVGGPDGEMQDFDVDGQHIEED